MEFLVTLGYRYKKICFRDDVFTPDAQKIISRYGWPDNVNGLKSFVEFLIFQHILVSPEQKIMAAQVEQALIAIYGPTDSTREELLRLSADLNQLYAQNKVSRDDIVFQVLGDLFGEDILQREPVRYALGSLFRIISQQSREDSHQKEGVVSDASNSPKPLARSGRKLNDYSHDELRQIWEGYRDQRGSLGAMAQALNVDHSNLSKELKKRGIRQTGSRKSTKTNKS
jgi:DNA-binding NtrC family response regulator